jgi:Flp pilus assembly protein TadG
MLLRIASDFWTDRRAAIAPLYAIALFALIGIAGVSLDYGRLMAMSSEMQNAADQAALAAATQLDGKSDSLTRAQTAVTQYFANAAPSGTGGELVVNRTILANDKKGSGLTDVSFTFYTSYDRNADTFGSITTDGTQAHVVMVKVLSRRAYYALTPVVDAISTRDITVDAVAGLDTRICQIPPLMICARDVNFPSPSDIGKGVLMEPGSQNGAWTPGTFGYLDFGRGAAGVKALLEGGGTTNQCTSSLNVQAQSGNMASAPSALNTRFDLYINPYTPADCTANGANCPAPNTRKDLVRAETWTFKNQMSTPTRPACSSTLTASNTSTLKVTVGDWQELPATSLPASSQVQGFPRDTCHYSGTCLDNKYGDGNWNLTGYRAAHPNVPVGLTTRYDIYKWEKANPALAMQPALANSGDPVVKSSCAGQSNNCDYTWTNYCSYPAPVQATTANTQTRDRRVISVAAVDCAGSSNHQFEVKRWVDVFLTEPSLNRTNANTQASQIYGEVIGAATRPDSASAFQYYGRNRVVLLR